MRTPVVFDKLPAPAAPPKKSRSKALKPPSRPHPAIAWKLLEDYNVWRNRCTAVKEQRAQHKVHDLKPTDERLELLAHVDAWCAERKLHPRLWLYVLFRDRRWFWPPKLTETELMNDRVIETYQRARGLDAYRKHVAPVRVGSSYDPNRDLADRVEQKKASMVAAGLAGKCMEETVDATLGYHPKSAVCVRCPLGPQCAAQLTAWVDFDIMSLRLGTITAEQARESVQAAERARREPRA